MGVFSSGWFILKNGRDMKNIGLIRIFIAAARAVVPATKCFLDLTLFPPASSTLSHASLPAKRLVEHTGLLL
jgi:hypothetical protein